MQGIKDKVIIVTGAGRNIGQVYSRLPRSDERDVEQAVAAATAAFPAWSATPAQQRSHLLLDIAERIEQRIDTFARAESVDSGKPLNLAR